MMPFMPGTLLGQKNTGLPQPGFNKQIVPKHNPKQFNGDYYIPPHGYGHYGFDQYNGLVHDHNDQHHHHHHYGYGHRFPYYYGYSYR